MLLGTRSQKYKTFPQICICPLRKLTVSLSNLFKYEFLFCLLQRNAKKKGEWDSSHHAKSSSPSGRNQELIKNKEGTAEGRARVQVENTHKASVLWECPGHEVFFSPEILCPHARAVPGVMGSLSVLWPPQSCAWQLHWAAVSAPSGCLWDMHILLPLF